MPQMFGGDTNLLVEFNVFHNLEREREVAKKTVDAEKTDDTEVTKEFVEWPSAVLADDLALRTISHCVGTFGNSERTRSLLHSCPLEVRPSARLSSTFE